jgi:microcystin-dependent protein
VTAFAGSAAPSGWLLCGGQTVSRTQYSGLFLTIGTTYGAGDGSTTFALPDLRGRTIAGEDDMGGTAANRLTSGGSGINGIVLGATGGSQTHVLTEAQMPSHTHTQNAHTHTQNAHGHTIVNPSTGSQILYMGNGASGFADQWGQGGQGGLGAGTPIQANTATNQNTTATNQNTGSGAAHNITQPTMVLNYIIKAA